MVEKWQKDGQKLTKNLSKIWYKIALKKLKSTYNSVKKIEIGSKMDT